MGAVAELILLLSFSLVTSVSSIACFVGYREVRLEELRQIQICRHDEICYFKYYLNELQEHVIDAGCRSKTQCKREQCAENLYKNRSLVDGTVLGKDSHVVLCEECCYTGLCNKQGCGLVLDLNQISRRCFGDCRGIVNMNQCLHWMECESENYMCAIHHEISTSTSYRLGCERKEVVYIWLEFDFGYRLTEMCELVMTIPNTADTCCDSDLCNIIPHFENIFHGNGTDDVKCPNNLTTSENLSTMKGSTMTTTTQDSVTKGPPAAYHRTTSAIPLISTPRQLVPGIVIGRRTVSMVRPR